MHNRGGARNIRALAIGKQLRIAGESLIAEEVAICIKIAREQTDASLEILIHRNAHGADMPPVSVQVLKRTAVSCSLHEASRDARKRIVGLVVPWTERRIANVHAVGIDIALRTRGGVLQIVATIVLCHVCALNKGLDADGKTHHVVAEFFRRRSLIVLAFALPTVHFLVFTEHHLFFANGGQCLGVKFDPIDRFFAGTAPVQVNAPIIVWKISGSQNAKGADTSENGTFSGSGLR